MLGEDAVELQVDGALEADAGDVGPVEENVGGDGVQQEYEGGDEGEDCRQVGAQGGARDEGRDGLEDGGLRMLDDVRIVCVCVMMAYFDGGDQERYKTLAVTVHVSILRFGGHDAAVAAAAWCLFGRGEVDALQAMMTLECQASHETLLNLTRSFSILQSIP